MTNGDHRDHDPAPGNPVSPLLTGETVYLAESYEITHSPGDATGITSPDRHTSGDLITVGAYSTIATAEAALDKRNATMRHMTPLGHFDTYGNGLLRYLTPVPGTTQRQWQQIRPLVIDALPH